MRAREGGEMCNRARRVCDTNEEDRAEGCFGVAGDDEWTIDDADARGEVW